MRDGAGQDEAPLAVASIGQVHSARLRPELLSELQGLGSALSSPEVVVKIQLPDIERRFRADIATVKRFCQLAMPQHVPPMEEIERQFLTEFDYRLEAQNLSEVRTNVVRPSPLGHLPPFFRRCRLEFPYAASAVAMRLNKPTRWASWVAAISRDGPGRSVWRFRRRRCLCAPRTCW